MGGCTRITELSLHDLESIDNLPTDRWAKHTVEMVLSFMLSSDFLNMFLLTIATMHVVVMSSRSVKTVSFCAKETVILCALQHMMQVSWKGDHR